MIDWIIEAATNQELWVGVGTIIGIVMTTVLTFMTIWAKKIKPWVEQKVVEPTQKTYSTINGGKFQALQKDVAKLKEELVKIDDEVNSVQETQATMQNNQIELRETTSRLEGKVDIIVKWVTDK